MSDALDCYEESKKELIAKYEKRIKDLEKERDIEEYEYYMENRMCNDTNLKLPEKLAVTITRFLFDSLNDLKSSKVDNLAKEFLNIIRAQIEMIDLNGDTLASVEEIDPLIKELHSVIEEKRTEIEQNINNLETLRYKNELLGLKVNVFYERNKEQSEVQGRIKLLERRVRRNKEKLELFDNLKIKNRELKTRARELNQRNKEQSEDLLGAESKVEMFGQEIHKMTEELRSVEKIKREKEILESRKTELSEKNKNLSQELSDSNCRIEVLGQGVQEIKLELRRLKDLEWEYELLKVREKELKEENKRQSKEHLDAQCKIKKLHKSADLPTIDSPLEESELLNEKTKWQSNAKLETKSRSKITEEYAEQIMQIKELLEEMKKKYELLKSKEVELQEKNDKQDIELLNARTRIDVLEQNGEQAEEKIKGYRNIEKELELIKGKKLELDKKYKEKSSELLMAKETINKLEDESNRKTDNIEEFENIEIVNRMLKLEEKELNENSQEQIKQIIKANDRIDTLENQVKTFEEEKSMGLKIMEELERLCENQRHDLKEFEGFRDKLNNLDEDYYDLKINFEKNKRHLKRKEEDIGMLSDENECFSAEVERLRNERTEGYQRLAKIEENNFYLKEELRKVQQVHRIYKTEHFMTKCQVSFPENTELKRKTEIIEDITYPSPN